MSASASVVDVVGSISVADSVVGVVVRVVALSL